MQSIKTSELSGAALDFAVALAAGYLSKQGDMWMVQLPYVGPRVHYRVGDKSIFSPSTSWAQGGPIIEQACIELLCESPGFRWVAMPQKGPEWRGNTPLVAAMRCFVGSTLGHEITIPEEFQ